MKTYIKSAGKNLEQDYDWYSVSENGDLSKLANGPGIANAIVKSNTGSRLPRLLNKSSRAISEAISDGLISTVIKKDTSKQPSDTEHGLAERLLCDEYFCLFIQHNQLMPKQEIKKYLSLLVYLPSLSLNDVLKKGYRIDYTGQRPIRTGFAWVAEDDKQSEILRHRAIGFLLKDTNDLIDLLEPCFLFDDSQAGFTLNIELFKEKLGEIDTFWKAQEKNLKPPSIQTSNSSFPVYAKDSTERRQEICNELLHPIGYGYLVDRYLSCRELSDYEAKLKRVLSIYGETTEWTPAKKSDSDNNSMKDRVISALNKKANSATRALSAKVKNSTS